MLYVGVVDHLGIVHRELSVHRQTYFLSHNKLLLHSGDLNTRHPITGNILIPDFYYSGIQMLLTMLKLVWYSDAIQWPEGFVWNLGIQDKSSSQIPTVFV